MDTIQELRLKFMNAWVQELKKVRIKLPHPLHDRKHYKPAVKRQHFASSAVDEIQQSTPSNEVLMELAKRYPAPDIWYEEED